MRIGAIHSRWLWAAPGVLAEPLANLKRSAEKIAESDPTPQIIADPFFRFI
jgi:hypothetical protein